MGRMKWLQRFGGAFLRTFEGRMADSVICSERWGLSIAGRLGTALGKTLTFVHFFDCTAKRSLFGCLLYALQLSHL